MSYTVFDRFVARCRFRVAKQHIGPHTRLCDIGCGLDARFLDHVRDRINFGLGLDLQVNANHPDGPLMVRANIARGLPLRSAQFDHAVMLAVFEHLAEPGLVLREVFRILVPGGSLIMTWPSGLVDPLLDLLHRAGIVSAEMESGQHQQRIPLERLRAMLREIGFAEFQHRTFEWGLNNLLVARKPGGFSGRNPPSERRP